MDPILRLADAVTPGPNDELYFVEPFVEKMTMTEFMSNIATGAQGQFLFATYVTSDQDTASTSNNGDIYYLQSQNGNMYCADDFSGQGAQSTSEFEPLRSDVPSDVAFCTEALGRLPDAVNLWIGDGRSITSIHSGKQPIRSLCFFNQSKRLSADPYENIYTVIRGAKHFTLLPPTEGWCLKERMFTHARYQRCPESGQLVIEPSEGIDAIHWSSISAPHIPGALSPEAHPIHITIGPGDTLYLPAGWWHHVRQLDGATTIALNWWYDMEMRGMSWVTLSFMRGVIEASPGNDTGDDDP
ncbi:hypothetical protein H0H92_000861 [Tricholoma furcatifolium]|nr:hypothetical protein H0H92_000861 [Tricholoma furcatifolium]